MQARTHEGIKTYVNNLDGNTYGLPTSYSGSFREGYYISRVGYTTDPTRSNSRIRAIVYAWMDKKGLSPSATGPFIDSLTDAQKTAMKGGDANNTIALFSDCGYAPNQSGGATCDDDAGADNPWDYITTAFGSNIKTYFTPSKDNISNLPEGFNRLDLWQASEQDITDARSNVVIVSDIVQLCAPTQYGNNNEQSYPTHSQSYVNIQTVFSNIFELTKPGGFLLFSVPYDGNPADTSGSATEVTSDANGGCNLWNWDYDADNEDTKINNTANGQSTGIDIDVNFTGGINCPAILRTFTRGAVYEYLDTAGFTSIVNIPISSTMNTLGIYWHATINTSGDWEAENGDANGEPASKSLIFYAERPAAAS